MKSKQQKQAEALERTELGLSYWRDIKSGKVSLSLAKLSKKDNAKEDKSIAAVVARKIKALERDSANLKRKLGTLWPGE